MEENGWLLLPVLFPVVVGILLMVRLNVWQKRRSLVNGFFLAALTAECIFILMTVKSGGTLTIWSVTPQITLTFQVDGVGRLFAVLTAAVWLLAGLHATAYMEHQQEERRFFGFYLIVAGVLTALDFSGNLITFYVFYELMTLTSLPLVLHERTKDSIMAGLKYLFYSVAGAFLALFGIFFLASVLPDLSFHPGGVVTEAVFSGQEGLFLAAVFCMVIGFGTKAGMFPLHGWLPTAHPVWNRG